MGYQAPADGSRGGWGLWIAQQLCDQLCVVHQDGLARARFRITGTPTS